MGLNNSCVDHSHRKRKGSLETRTEPPVLRTSVENQAILEPIPLYRKSERKQTQEQGSENCLWNHILNFLCDYCQFFSFFFCQDANKKGSNCAIIGFNLSKKRKLELYKTQSGKPNYVDHKFFFNILLGGTCTKTWGQTSKYYRAG